MLNIAYFLHKMLHLFFAVFIVNFDYITQEQLYFFLFQMEKVDGTYESAISYFPVYTKGIVCLNVENVFKMVFLII